MITEEASAMSTHRRTLTYLLGIAAAFGLLAWAGCSCKESEKPKEEVVRVQGAPQPPQGQVQAPAQAAAQPAAPQPRAASDQPDHKVGESLIQAPADYLRTVTISAPRQARKSLDTSLIQNEVTQFSAMEGRYPKSLDELVQWRGAPLPETPGGYVYKYDAAAGKLEVVPAQ
jgi:hypothetical protein